MKLRRSEWAQLGDSTKKGMSLVEGRLWSKYWCYHNRPSPTLATIFGPVSKLRSQASLHGVNHNMPFPTALKPLFSTFSVLSPSACRYIWWNFFTLWVLVVVINSRQSGSVGWVWGVLIVWGGEWGKRGGFGVIIRVKCGLQIVVGRVWRSYQQIVNNLWKMVWKLINKKVPKNLTFENRLSLTIYGLNANKLGE